MKWMIFVLVAMAVSAHYYFRHLDWAQRNNENSMKFTIEMMKHKPIMIHPLEEK